MERWLERLPLIIIAAGAAAVVMIAAGLFDPRPIGTLRWTETDLRFAIPAASQHADWLAHDLPPGSLSLRLNASLSSGEHDIGYGIILGNEEQVFVVSVSPLGYASIWQDKEALEELGTGSAQIMPWQTWPHIASGTDTNEIWIDIDSTGIQVRVNRELLWRGSVTGQWQQAGVWSESFGGPAVVNIQRVELFSQ